MNYTMSIEKMKQCKYPNLIAEFAESHYSICTLSEHMGLGRCKEDNKMIWAKLFGTEELNLNEAVGLMRLFGVDADYLLSEELAMYGDVTMAYLRHYESNRRAKEEFRLHQIAEDIRYGLKEKLYLADFMREVLSWTEEQVNRYRQCCIIQTQHNNNYTTQK